MHLDIDYNRDLIGNTALTPHEIGQIAAKKEASKPRSLSAIAREIRKDWGVKVNYAARPYLDAMGSLDTFTDRYGEDSATMVVAYFLSNATSWRGEVARRIKSELNAMLKANRAAGNRMHRL